MLIRAPKKEIKCVFTHNKVNTCLVVRCALCIHYYITILYLVCHNGDIEMGPDLRKVPSQPQRTSESVWRHNTIDDEDIATWQSWNTRACNRLRQSPSNLQQRLGPLASTRFQNVITLSLRKALLRRRRRMLMSNVDVTPLRR